MVGVVVPRASTSTLVPILWLLNQELPDTGVSTYRVQIFFYYWLLFFSASDLFTRPRTFTFYFPLDCYEHCKASTFSFSKFFAIGATWDLVVTPEIVWSGGIEPMDSLQ